MKTPQQLINTKANKTQHYCRDGFNTKQVIELMEEYAIEYHESEVKKLNIPAVMKSVCDHENIKAGHSPFVACVCKDCGEEI